MTREYLTQATFRALPSPVVYRNEPGLPLTAEEEADLWLWAANLRPLKRRVRMLTLLAAGLGCGLTGGEVATLARDEVTRDTNGVHVTVTRSADSTIRTVTCRADWEDRLWDSIQQVAPGDYLFQKTPGVEPLAKSVNTYLNLVKQQNPPVGFNTTALRNTWIRHHLMEGTPLNVLLPAAGLKEPQALDHAYAHLPAVPAATSAVVLRGGVA